MKLKEINRNGNITWSPKLLNNSYLVVGTASQQLDSSFSSKSQLEIFEYVPNAQGCDMPVVCSLSAETKFSKLLWGNVCDNYGLIVGGSETGSISIYDCKRLLDGNLSQEQLSRVCVKREHKGPVHAMDFNKFKSNLLATGGDESDIFIWDLDKFDEPMTPGNKSQPFEEIRTLSWNHKVQHILGSTSNHRCQIWDLRKSDPVIKLSDTQMKMKSSKLVWHPEISTRLCISSEDDHTPMIQLWDLRYIQCPFHTLQRHTKGIVDLEWCIDDPDILMSVGRDRQIICWNMSAHNNSSGVDTSSEVIYEWQLDQDLINEARFCPKHPGLLSVSSFDCHISLYSLLGGRSHVPRELSDTVIDSFPLELNDEDNNEIERIKREAEKAAELQLAPSPCLLKAPKWLKRPCGASFAFGGKLIQFCKSESSRSRNNSVSQTGTISSSDNIYKIIISQVSTHKALVEASTTLDNAIQGTDSLLSYCEDKIEIISTEINETQNKKIKLNCKFDLDIWKFIGCHFYENSRSAFIRNLGYEDLNARDTEKSEYNENLFSDKHEISSDESENFTNNNFELPINNLQLLPKLEGKEKSLSIALMTGDIESAIDICLQENRSGEAAILAVSSGRQDLFEKVQSKIFELTKQSPTTQLIYLVVKRNWNELVSKCDLKHWKEALAWLLTYASTDELLELCEILGQRLEEQDNYGLNDSSNSLSACICYICAGSINNFVRCWLKNNSFRSTKDLQRLVEIVVLLCKSVGDEDFSLIKEETADIFRRYAFLLASQGNLSIALKYLGNNDESNIVMLKHRICERLRNRLPSGIVAPKLPFKPVPVLFSVTKQNVKTPINASMTSYLDSRKLNNQISSAFPNSQNFPMKQDKFPTSPMKSNVPNIIPNDLQMNYMSNQFNCNPVPNQPSISNIVPQNYPPSMYASQQPTQLPYVSQNTNNFIPPSVQSQISTSHVIQKPNNQTNKSAWNDPPLLSENYRSETTKEEVKVQSNFFNPAASITDISDLPNLGNLANSSETSFMNIQTNFSPLPYTNSNSDQTKMELSKSFATEPKLNDQRSALSPEYEHMQKVLIDLIEKCRQADKSRQIKMKMDDIQKKIINLFDLIRTQSLSPELTTGLNLLVSTLEKNQYRQSYDEVNHIIQTVNFSEAGLYLPSVKILIQCAIKILE